MKLIEFNVVEKGSILEYTLGNDIIEFKPVIDLNKYPLYCVEMLVDNLSKEYEAILSELCHVEANEWLIQLVVK